MKFFTEDRGRDVRPVLLDVELRVDACVLPVAHQDLDESMCGRTGAERWAPSAPASTAPDLLEVAELLDVLAGREPGAQLEDVRGVVRSRPGLGHVRLDRIGAGLDRRPGVHLDEPAVRKRQRDHRHERHRRVIEPEAAHVKGQPESRARILLTPPPRQRKVSDQNRGGEIMRKILSLVLIGMVVFAPAIAAAQTGGATGGGTTGAGGSSSTPGSTGGSGTTGSGTMSTPSTGSPTSPSASPSSSGTSAGKPLSTITNQSDCETAGGDWQASTSVCQAKK